MDRQETHCDLPGKRLPIIMEDRHGTRTGRSTRRFSGGRGAPNEAGVYSFWTVMAGAQPIFSVRTIEGRTVENRLSEYASMTVQTVGAMHMYTDRVLPATDQEIQAWLDSHAADAAFLVPE